METARLFALVTQGFSIASLVLALVALDRLRRFARVTRPELAEELGNLGPRWLRYVFSSRDSDQPNLRRMKAVVKVHIFFTVLFWAASLAARLGLLERWIA